MRRIELALPKDAWQGIKTRYQAESKYISVDQFTAGSQNFTTSDNGVIKKRQDQVAYNSSALASAPQDQFEAVFADGTRHLLVQEGGRLSFSAGDGVFATVTSGYSAAAHFEFANARGRVYFCNGVDSPQCYDKTATYGGVSYSVPQTRAMGVTPPTVGSFSGVQAAGGNIASGSYYYKVTYSYASGQESNGSAATSAVTVSAGPKKITLSNIPIGGYGVESRKIYRSSDQVLYYLVTTISDNTTTTFDDTLATADTTLPIPTANGLPPTFSFLAYNLDRLWVVNTATPYYLYWSEAGLPDVWSGSFLSCNPNDTITGVSVLSEQVVVFNKYSMGVIQGRDSSTFRYVEIAKVGCVDTRSIQLRTIDGLPTIVWLSPTGDVYSFNGSFLQRIGDDIQDQMYALQQTRVNRRSITQTSQADFNLGSGSPWISLSLTPGFITGANPHRVWQTEADWEGGSSLTNCATHGTSNLLQAPLRYASVYTAGGSFSGVQNSSGSLILTTTAAYTGETQAGSAQSPNPGFLDIPAHTTTPQRICTPFIPTRSGTMTNFNFVHAITQNATSTWTVKVWQDSAGVPSNTILYSTGVSITGTLNTVVTTFNVATSFAMTGGTRYWVGIQYDGDPSDAINRMSISSNAWSGGSYSYAGLLSDSVWQKVEASTSSGPIGAAAGTITFVSTAVAANGTWTSDVYDSGSDSAVGATISHTGAFPAGTTSTTTVDATNDPTFLTGISTVTANSLNGSASVSALTNLRYWRLKVRIDTTDDTLTATIGAATLAFNTTATWISEAIDHTTDVVSLNALSLVASTPAGTTAAVTIATSTDNISYSGYTALGSAVVHRYSKIKVVLTTTGSDDVTPAVTSITFNWTVTGTFTSSILDLSSTPAGWDVFQAVTALSGGTVVYKIRAASTSLGVAGQPWTAVTNGNIPTITPQRFAQYQVIITASANVVPTTDSITINWLIGSAASLRMASMFHNQTYYLCGAEANQTTNNVVFVLERSGVWQVFYGWTASTMGLYFGEPYFGDATVGTVRKINQGYGSSYSMIVRTKSLGSDLGGRAEEMKAIRGVYFRVLGTGATFTPTYSLNGGSTWNTLANPETGLTSYVSASDSVMHTVKFVPVTSGNIFGREIMFKIVNTDAFDAQLDSIRMFVDVSEREVLNG